MAREDEERESTVNQQHHHEANIRGPQGTDRLVADMLPMIKKNFADRNVSQGGKEERNFLRHHYKRVGPKHPRE